ncbi:hypothetical protein UVI_02029980 [Ustilaginoidea virens]|uniref:Uncharacterized protein n=1 Tax=Ustilaginoidea virens TaxID=1159556 RepID=A0A1B5L5I2_USTVR|nr:hypothetical protein UVI_02029980 [Ustilaginoidea virens]
MASKREGLAFFTYRRDSLLQQRQVRPSVNISNLHCVPSERRGLPVRRLPGKKQGSPQDAIRRLASKGPDGDMKTAESLAAMLAGYAGDERTAGEKGNVRGRKGQHRVHYEGVLAPEGNEAAASFSISPGGDGSSGARFTHDSRGNVPRPQGKMDGVNGG